MAAFPDQLVWSGSDSKGKVHEVKVKPVTTQLVIKMSVLSLFKSLSD